MSTGTSSRLRRRGSAPAHTLVLILGVLTAARSAPTAAAPNSTSQRPATPARNASEFDDEPTVDDVRASSFQEITPGKTTRAELFDAIGKPLEVSGQGGEEILTYRLGPFPKVEILVADDLVASVVVFLVDPADPKAVAAELGLAGFAPAPIFAQSGERLGEVYPERGIVFSFEPGSDPPTVLQLVLEPVSPEFFLLRARDDSVVDYRGRLADLNYVLEIEPENSTAMWLKARIFEKAGHFKKALTFIEDALELEPRQGKYRLLRAELRHRREYFQGALAEAKAVLARPDTDLSRARAETLLGDSTLR